MIHQLKIRRRYTQRSHTGQGEGRDRDHSGKGGRNIQGEVRLSHSRRAAGSAFIRSGSASQGERSLCSPSVRCTNSPDDERKDIRNTSPAERRRPPFKHLTPFTVPPITQHTPKKENINLAYVYETQGSYNTELFGTQQVPTSRGWKE